VRLVAAILVAVLGAVPLGAQQSRAADSVLARLEQRYDSMRYLRDQLEVTKARGTAANRWGVSRARLEAEYEAAWRALNDGFEEPAAARLVGEAARAVQTMMAAHRRSPNPDATSIGPETAPYLAGAASGSEAERRVDSLQRAIYADYAAGASQIVVDGDTLDRLTILGRLGTTEDRAHRERLWRALDQAWRTVNGHGEPDSRYARLLALRAEAWRGGVTPMARLAEELGLTIERAERWLLAGLETWRSTLPDSLVEPWDVYYRNGAAARRLGTRLSLDSIFALNDRFYRTLGADIGVLGVQYANLPGRVPVAYTTFGATGRWQGAAWVRMEPWVFTGYRIGGLDNLNELLHETGHAVHIAAIRARPAFNDWPDSDVFTEAVADLAMLEIYEPAWQMAFLGDSVALEESLRAKYAAIVFDMAWALFEYRVHRAGAPPPNRLWTEIAARYLGVKPHPEYSWWAARGQLINSPGYLSTYALGAFVTADLRAQAARRFGRIAGGNPRWYPGVSRALFRFGLTRPSAAVVREFRGRPISPDALLADLRRIRRPGRRRTTPTPRSRGRTGRTWPPGWRGARW